MALREPRDRSPTADDDACLPTDHHSTPLMSTLSRAPVCAYIAIDLGCQPSCNTGETAAAASRSFGPSVPSTRTVRCVRVTTNTQRYQQ